MTLIDLNPTSINALKISRIDNEFNMIINYFGKFKTFRYISFYDVLMGKERLSKCCKGGQADSQFAPIRKTDRSGHER